MTYVIIVPYLVKRSMMKLKKDHPEDYIKIPDALKELAEDPIGNRTPNRVDPNKYYQIVGAQIWIHYIVDVKNKIIKLVDVELGYLGHW